MTPPARTAGPLRHVQPRAGTHYRPGSQSPAQRLCRVNVPKVTAPQEPPTGRARPISPATYDRLQRAVAVHVDQHGPTPCMLAPDVWTSDHKPHRRRAIAGCRVCPLLDRCHDAALGNRSVHGVGALLRFCTLGGHWLDSNGTPGKQWTVPRGRNQWMTPEQDEPTPHHDTEQEGAA